MNNINFKVYDFTKLTSKNKNGTLFAKRREYYFNIYTLSFVVFRILSHSLLLTFLKFLSLLSNQVKELSLKTNWVVHLAVEEGFLSLNNAFSKPNKTKSENGKRKMT